MKSVIIKSGEHPAFPVVVDAETDQILKGVTGVDISIRPKNLPTAEIQLTAVEVVDIEAKAKFVMKHPYTGKMAEVRSILFADQTIFRGKE